MSGLQELFECAMFAASVKKETLLQSWTISFHAMYMKYIFHFVLLPKRKRVACAGRNLLRMRKQFPKVRVAGLEEEGFDFELHVMDCSMCFCTAS